MRRAFGFHRPRRAVTAADLAGVPRARKPRLVIPPSPPSRLEVIDGAARFTIDRELYSPNKTLWGSPEQKKRDRDSWGVAIYNAIVLYLAAEGHELTVHDTQRIANRRVPVTQGGRVVVRRLHRAPRQHYALTILREVPKLANFIRDDDNLAFAGKALRDALQAHCVIYEDSRAWLTHPLPIQRVAEDGCYRTIVDVTPWAPPTLSGRSHAAGQ